MKKYLKENWGFLLLFLFLFTVALNLPVLSIISIVSNWENIIIDKVEMVGTIIILGGFNIAIFTPFVAWFYMGFVENYNKNYREKIKE